LQSQFYLVQGIIKHIIAFTCVFFLTHLFISNFHKEDMVFDPIDTEDNAMIKQGITYLQFYEEPSTENTKNTVFSPEQRNGKKAKDAKYVPFELFFYPGSLTVIEPGVNIREFSATLNNKYDYLFYKEINPPPSQDPGFSERLIYLDRSIRSYQASGLFETVV